ncbi:MAG: hypothetical protein QOJ10_1458 [Chloroflexota bacterium]|jgi:predicted site-specific integrase-resolvase|nr:hypothetical protein [Chloroflexota bacterium]
MLTDRLLTLDSAAQVLLLQPSTLHRWVRQGRIRHYELSLPDSVGGKVLAVPYVKVREVLADLRRQR